MAVVLIESCMFSPDSALRLRLRFLNSLRILWGTRFWVATETLRLRLRSRISAAGRGLGFTLCSYFSNSVFHFLVNGSLGDQQILVNKWGNGENSSVEFLVGRSEMQLWTSRLFSFNLGTFSRISYRRKQKTGVWKRDQFSGLYLIWKGNTVFKGSKPTNVNFQTLKVLLTFCSVIHSRKAFCQSMLITASPWNDLMRLLFLSANSKLTSKILGHTNKDEGFHEVSSSNP